MDYQNNILRNSHVNLNKVGASSMERKFHRRYYINILLSAYLSFNWQERLAIDEDGLRLMERKRYWQVLSFSNHDTSNIPNLSNPNVNLSLAYPKKCDNMFSDLKSDHIFSHFSGTYLVYILFIIVWGNYPLTLKKGSCRNLLSIDSQLNRIDPSTNVILPPNVERGYITKLEILLEGVFRYSID